MKIRTKLIIAFLAVVLMPVLLLGATAAAVIHLQLPEYQSIYGITRTGELLSSNSMQVFTHLADTIRSRLQEDMQVLENPEALAEWNEELTDRETFLVVMKNDTVYFTGDDTWSEDFYDALPVLEDTSLSQDKVLEQFFYMGDDWQCLASQMPFVFSDGSAGRFYVVTHAGAIFPQIRSILIEVGEMIILVLLVTAILLIFWLYNSIVKPLATLQKATRAIRDGNLDFSLEVTGKDEISELCQDFEDMRIRLKQSAEEKIQYDRENKILIRNISHDLKTPLTAVKGYCEGILDGVASSPEKMMKYVRTIYNKANDMQRLIDELTLYSRIDTNRIPYHFTKIPVNAYFADCAEELATELESKNIELTYSNFLSDDVMVIGDTEQLKRVINNIISNSIKYMDKKKGFISLRIRDEGDFIRVEVEDNGKGIGTKDLPYIFDRFYRTDSSRNSSTGGSGIGLSIVKKIIEDHGGRIWATSKEGTGTIMHFVLRKYQEAVQA